MEEETEFDKKDRLFKLANDPKFNLAIMVAEDGKPLLQKSPFKTIGDRMRLIDELEKAGFIILKKD